MSSHAADTTAHTARSTPGRPRGKAANTALWVLQILLAALFVFAAVPKLLGAQGAVQGFDQIGFGQWFRYFTGAVELAGAVGLLVPRLAGPAALGLAGVMVGAIFAHLLALPPAVAAVIPAVVGTLLGLIAWVRWPRGAAAGAPRRTS